MTKAQEPEMDLYAFLAPYYDELFPVGEAQLDFLMQRLGEPGIASLLDAGCGTGRHLELFAQRGLRVAGIEPSATMAELARQRLEACAASFELAVCSMAEADRHLSGPYDAAVCLGNTLAHLGSPADLASGLSAMSRLLAPGGLLITQTVNFDAVLARGEWSFPERSIEHPEHGRLVFRRRYSFEDAPGRIGFHLALEGERLNLTERLDLRPWTFADQATALKSGDLEMEATHGNWMSAPVSPETPALILSARRRG